MIFFDTLGVVARQKAVYDVHYYHVDLENEANKQEVVWWQGSLAAR